MQDLHLQPMTFSQARHPTKTREINGTETPHTSYLAEVQSIAQQASRSVADRLTVLSRFSFPPTYRACARDIHRARRGWDPEADRIVLEAAIGLSETFTFGQLVEHAAIGHRGHRAAIRLIGDGDIRKHLLDPFVPDTVCWRAAA